MKSIQKLKSDLALYLRKKQVRIESMRLKKDASPKEQAYIKEEEGLIDTIQQLLDHLEGKYLGRIPPRAPELEEAIIGALILEAHSYQSVLFLEPDHFDAVAHQQIFTIIRQMHRSRIPVDMRTVVIHLRKAGKLELVGGAHYIAEVTSKVSSAANIEYHSRVLVEFAIRRKLINLGGTLINDAYEDTTDVFELLDALDRHLNEIKEPIKQPQHV